MILMLGLNQYFLLIKLFWLVFIRPYQAAEQSLGDIKDLQLFLCMLCFFIPCGEWIFCYANSKRGNNVRGCAPEITVMSRMLQAIDKLQESHICVCVWLECIYNIWKGNNVLFYLLHNILFKFYSSPNSGKPYHALKLHSALFYYYVCNMKFENSINKPA